MEFDVKHVETDASFHYNFRSFSAVEIGIFAGFYMLFSYCEFVEFV